MKHLLSLVIGVWLMPAIGYAGTTALKPQVGGIDNLQAIAVGLDGRTYVSVGGATGKDGDGAVMVVANGKAAPFATGLDDPRGLVAFQKWLFVADKQRIWRIDGKGKAQVFVPRTAFPAPPAQLSQLAVDRETGALYVSDMGGKARQRTAIYRVDATGKVTAVTDLKRWPDLQRPTAMVLDGANHLLVADAGTGTLYRVYLADSTVENVAAGFGEAAGITWDLHGRLYVSDAKTGRIFVIARPGSRPQPLADSLPGAGAICLDARGTALLVADAKAGTVTALPARVPGADVDTRPLPLASAIAFPNLQWTGWQGTTDAGERFPLRPIVLTHAGDGNNRVFVAIQQGVIHVFPNDAKADKTRVFLDIRDRVRYNDKENEEGFLGLAFHPQYRKNGQFFVFYTRKNAQHPHTNVVARFRVRKDDPDQADPASEEEILRIEHPFWNHDGGTICFGADGYLYIAVGDGGLGGDPYNNGQDPNSLLGRILRIDIDKKDTGKNYAVPADNPFVGRLKARPETWAYGLRNVWRMAFDRKTNRLWAGDVGQNLYEEINLIEKGGNYGWNLREGLHPFGPRGVSARPDLIDPIWEYHHQIGVCIIGGHVYRGAQLPELDGAYLYGDYTTGKVWALQYDGAAKRVVANRPISTPGLPILSFGADEAGEIYFLTTSVTGRGIYQFQRSASPRAKAP